MFLPGGQLTKEWFIWYQSVDLVLRRLRLEVSRLLDPQDALLLLDGITAPTAITGQASIYVDTATGDLMVRFGDGVTKTLATDV
jgi:hypothetical protein